MSKSRNATHRPDGNWQVKSFENKKATVITATDLLPELQKSKFRTCYSCCK